MVTPKLQLSTRNVSPITTAPIYNLVLFDHSLVLCNREHLLVLSRRRLQSGHLPSRQGVICEWYHAGLATLCPLPHKNLTKISIFDQTVARCGLMYGIKLLSNNLIIYWVKKRTKRVIYFTVKDVFKKVFSSRSILSQKLTLTRLTR